MNQLSNGYPRRTLAEFGMGDVRERNFSIARQDLQNFIAASGDIHPVHTSAEFAQSRGFGDVLVHGMCITSRCSAFIAEEIVGSHGLLVAMSADYLLPVFCDDALTWQGKVSRVDVVAETVEIKWDVRNNRNMVVQRGSACAWLGEGR